MRLRWPLVGRTEELRLIAEAVSDPDIAGLVVCGAAGVGKSRIAREALAAAAATGAEIRWAIATESAKGLPFGAFAAWTEPGHTDSLELVRVVIDHLTGGTGEAPVIVGVDDVQLLDDLSAFILHQIALREAAKIVVTIRDGEPVPAAVQDLWKTGQFMRLDLQPLSMDENTALLEVTLGGAGGSRRSARRLWKLTRGNVLYLRNVVEQEIGDGRLACAHGYWHWRGDPVLAPGLVELVDTRMGALPAGVSDVVDALAVGEPIELASLARITDPAAIEDAEVRGLIALANVDGGVEVRVAHPLYGEVRRNRAAATRLRRLRGLVAAELAASERRDDVQVVVRCATLSLDADIKPPPEFFVRAAHGAAWQVDVQLAERLADAAVRGGGGADAVFIHSFLLSWLGRGADAEALLDSVRREDFNDAERDRLVFARVTNRLFSVADADGLSTMPRQDQRDAVRRQHHSCSPRLRASPSRQGMRPSDGHIAASSRWCARKRCRVTSAGRTLQWPNSTAGDIRDGGISTTNTPSPGRGSARRRASLPMGSRYCTRRQRLTDSIGSQS